MKHSFPLSAQIFTIFLLNIVILHLVFVVFFSSQFKLGWEEVLLEPVCDRVQFICMMLHPELVEKPSNEWEAALENYGKAYGVKLYIFDNTGAQLAGTPIKLPVKVSQQLEARLKFFKDGPPAMGPRFREVMQKQDSSGAPSFGRNFLPYPRFAPPPGRFLVHTNDPDMFWIGSLVPLSKGQHGFDKMGILFAATSNLFSTKLIYDFAPIFLVGAGIVTVSLLIWWPFIYFTTSSINRLTSTTEKIAEGKFDIRFVGKRNDEIGRLGQAINTLASRLSLFVSGQKRFLGDIAHELCSPIARLQVATAILEQNSQPEMKETLSDIREEVEQMSNLVNELLAFSKAGILGKEISLVSVNLEDLLSRIATKWQAPGLKLNVAKELHCLGEELLLERAFSNVIRNSQLYASGATEILIEAERKDDLVMVRIADDGPGVPEETISLLGEPFYRPESSRNRASGGVGLGLAIVKTCIEACNGKLKIQNRVPHGLEVTVYLPVSAD